MSSTRKPSTSAIAALKDRLRKQKEEAAKREAEAAEQQRKEKEDKERMEREVAEAEAVRKRRVEARRLKREDRRAQGLLLTATERVREDKNRIFREQLAQLADGSRVMRSTAGEIAATEKQVATEDDVATLRNPVVSIMGHVDSGKTSFLDHLRGGSSVRAKEAGGITQQMSITELSRKRLRHLCAPATQSDDMIKFASMWLLDTPGHAAFRNFRERGSDLGDLAIVMVNLLHGIELTTLECLENIIESGMPFVIVANKVDKLYGWNASEPSLDKQPSNTQDEYEKRIGEIFRTIASRFPELDLHEVRQRTFPVSAKTGQGVAYAIRGIIHILQTQEASVLATGAPEDSLHGFVLEVQEVDGLGTTIDALVVRGTLSTGDSIVLGSVNSPVVTNVRAMYRNACLQQPLKVITGETVHVQIVAAHLNAILPGSQFYRVAADAGDKEEQLEVHRRTVVENVQALATTTRDCRAGISVFAPTLGAIESIVHHASEVETPHIPILHTSIGAVHRRDIAKAAIMLDDPMTREFGVIAAFGVTVSKEECEYAAQLGVKLIACDVIYQLFDQLQRHFASVLEQRRAQVAGVAVFPCALRILPRCIFNAKAPIVLGVQVMEGQLQIGTPLCVPCRDSLRIGRVTNIQRNKVDCTRAQKGEQVSIKLEASPGDQTLTVGRQFQESDEIVSHLSRASIDALKQFYKEDLKEEDWKLVVKLKRQLGIV